MVQLKIRNEDRAETLCLARRFPFSIGRSQANNLCLPASGVWDRHAEIRLKMPEGFELAALGEALVTVNDTPIQQTILRNGDWIGLGTCKIQFALGPTQQRSLCWREWMIWLALAALCLGQVALIYQLPG